MRCRLSRGIKGMEFSRVNWSFPGSERSLSKRSVGEQTRRNALLVYERGKSAGEHASYATRYITRYPIRKMHVASRSE